MGERELFNYGSQKPEKESGVALVLGRLIEDCEKILEAAETGRVQEEGKEEAKAIFSKVMEIAKGIREKKVKEKNGLGQIVDELDKITELVKRGKIDERSLVADTHLRWKGIINFNFL